MSAGPTEITSDDWRTNCLPMTICGGSGAGKTTTARALHDRFPGRSILFDLDHEPGFGWVAESVQELADYLAAGHRSIAVRPPVDVVEEPELFPETVRFLLQIGDGLREQGDGRIQFLMDEAQDLQDRWVAVALKRFRKRRIKPIAMTQNPLAFPTDHRKIAEYNGWLSPPPAKMAEDLRAGTGYPVDLLEQLDHYQMLVLGDDWQPVARFQASSEYVE